MTKDLELSRYIALLRHNYTNYDKYLRIMYDEFGEQTDIRKYVNSILYRVMKNQLDANTALQGMAFYKGCWLSAPTKTQTKDY